MKIGNQQRNNNLIKDINIIIDLYSAGYSQQQLGKIYNVSNSTIRYYLLKNNIKIRNLKESCYKIRKKKNIYIDTFFSENLIGWLLGDGGLRKCNRSTNPHFVYTDKKYSNIKYIQNILSDYNINSNINLNKHSMCFQLQSESLQVFNEYYELFYGYKGLNENNQKRKILPNVIITPIILLNWYIGDGGIKKGSGTYNNSAVITCKYKNDYIFSQLKEKFNISIHKTNGKDEYKYYFSNKSLKKLLIYIGKCPINDYKYKWIVRRSTTIIEPSLMDDGIV